MDCSPPGSSVHGIFQAGVLEWGPNAFSNSPSSQLPRARHPGVWSQVGCRKHQIWWNSIIRSDGIPAELFQILKDDAIKVLNSICQQIRKTQQWPVFILIPKKGNAKVYLNYCTVALISHARKVMLKILQARLQLYINQELWDGKAGFRKGRETRDKIANIHCITEKARGFQKNIYFCFIDYAKAFDCVDHNKLENSLKETGI